MNRVLTLGLRIAGLAAIALMIVQCGDSSVHVTTGVDPSPGTFEGFTDEGGSITVLVGSIERISFECDSETIENLFNPPEQVSGGHFDVSFNDGGRRFRVEGRFSTNDTLSGTIDDADDQCDVSFEATRSGVTPRTPTPGLTPTPNGSETTSEPTAESPSPSVSVTQTPSESGSGGATPSTSVSASPAPCGESAGGTCPSKLTTEGEGEQADLDSGWTGIAHDSKVVGKGTLTVGLDCHGNDKGSCGACDVCGPIASTTVVDNHRCAADSSKTCTSNADCGSGDCVFFFGAPLPLSSGGVPVCVTNRINGSITGTADPDSGEGEAMVSLTSSVFTAVDVAEPCPRCSGAGFNQTGTCDIGARAGMACTVHGTSALFGNTSFDCPPPPGANVGNLQIPLNPTTGTSMITASSSKKCVGFGFTSFDCFCDGQQQPNACNSGTCVLDGTGAGKCSPNMVDNQCSVEIFRGCTGNADCRPPSEGGTCSTCATGMQTCTTKARPCFPGATAGMVTGPIVRTGTPSTTNPTLVSTFCIPATSSSGVNTAAGLPGPGALSLPSKACFDDTCSF